MDPKWRAFVHLSTLTAQALPEAFRITGKVDYDADQTQQVAAPLPSVSAGVTLQSGPNVTFVFNHIAF